jgi:hypothetical protein
MRVRGVAQFFKRFCAPVSMATEQKADVPQCLQLSDIREHLIRLEETVRARVSTCCVACLFHDHLIAC